MNASDALPVLVVGGGPSGLTAAAELARRGVPVRCVDRASGPSPFSKALGVWPRTLELLRRLGGGRHIAERALPQRSMRYYSNGRVVADLRFRRRSLQPVCLPQPDVEELLHDALARAGTRVEWETQVLGLEQGTDEVKVGLRGPDGVEHAEAFSWVVGADGPRSTVREALGIGFDGATHELAFVVADIHLDGPLEADVTHYYCSPRGILVTCGLPSGRFRIFTSAPPDTDRDTVDLDVVQQLVDERGPGTLRLSDPEWISVFSVHSRHAARTRDGRAFLVGDAAHIHSPAGGQGLNTGVADAHNLAWKLALVWHGHANERLLGSFETERGQVARSVIRQAGTQTRIWLLRRRHEVALRDNALRVASGLGLLHLDYLPWLAGQRTVYPAPEHSAAARTLPVGRPLPGWDGFVAGGLVPRLPVWDAVSSRRRPLRSALTDLRYTLLVHGDGDASEIVSLTGWARENCPAAVETRRLGRKPRHLGPPGRVEPGPQSRRPGRTTLVLVRPDGHVDLMCPVRDAARMRARLGELFGRPVRSER